MPILLYTIILIPAVQTKALDYFTAQLSEEFNTDISVGRVYFKPFKHLVLDDVLLLDEQKDTLVFVQKMSSAIDSFRLSKKQIFFRNIQLNKPLIQVEKVDSLYNYSFLLAHLGKKDSVIHDRWSVGLSNIHIKNGALRYGDRGSNIDADIHNLNVAISNIKQDSIVSFALKAISFSEKRGFRMMDGSCTAKFNDTFVSATEIKLNTSYSSLYIDSVFCQINKKFEGIEQLGTFHLGVKPSYISPLDFSFFNPNQNYLRVPVGLSGNFYGRIDNIKGRKVRLEFGSQSSIATSFDISGLPNIDESFLYLNISHLKSSPNDLERLLSFSRGTAVKLPSALQSLEEIRYKGNLTGFLSDMVAYGQFNSALGSIDTDIGVKIDEEKGLLFAGNLSTQGFNIGKLAKADSLMENVTMSVTIKGQRKSASSFYAHLQGNIDSLRINDYDYTNINLNGLFANNKFDGHFAVKDPNGALAFNGKIDFSGDVPNFDFNATIRGAKLDKLNIVPSVVDNNFSLNLETNFSGRDLNDIVGFVKVKDALFESPIHDVKMDSLLIISVREGDDKHLILQSDLAEGDLIGKYNFKYLGSLINRKIVDYLPALKKELEVKEFEYHANEFTFSCRLKKVSSIMNLIQPNIVISDEGLVLGRYNSETGYVDVSGELGYLKYKNVSAIRPELNISSKGDESLSLITRFKNIDIDEETIFQNLSLHQHLYRDTVVFNVFWNNWNEYTNSGSILTKTHLRSSDRGLYALIDIEPSYVMIRDSLWEVQPCRVNYHPLGLSFKNFRVHHQNQEIGINGFLHKTISDGLNIHIQNINLGHILSKENLSSMDISGLLNGNISIKDVFRVPIVTSDLAIKDFEFNKDMIGDFYLETNYEPDNKHLLLDSKVMKNNTVPLSGGGYFDMDKLSMDMAFQIDSLEIGFLNLYLKRIMQNLSGTASGDIAVVGPISEPELLGRLNINKAFFDVDLLKTTYSISDSVIFEPNRMLFQGLNLSDRFGNSGTFNGDITHTGFHDMSYDLVLLTNNMLVLDTKSVDNQLYYGTVFSNGNMSITGTTSDIIIDISGTTEENTNFYIPLRGEESVEESNFIRFVKDETLYDIVDKEEVQGYEADLSGMTVTMDLDITPEAKTQVIFDSKSGDILKGSGNGNLQIKMDKEGGINFYGDFSFTEGDYLFTLQNVLNKRFLINQGSNIQWNGNPYDANIDLNATYKLKTSLYDLVASSMQDDPSLDEYRRRIPVHCNMLLTDRLTKPAIQFEIVTPSAQKNNQDFIDAFINSEEELNRQVLSLLVLNRFYSDENQSANVGNGNRSTGNNAALVTTSEMLSNQLSNWLSQISNDFDIGVSYRPGDEVTSDEVEVALSTQVFNNRVSINGNVGYGQDETRTSALIGDFDVDVKLNASGSLRAKAYTHSNDDIVYTSSPTTQGVGISFNEEFDTLRELMHRYWMKIRGEGKKEEEVETKEEKETL
ncbi:translocation/assembly module TamB domain-containing protein [Carboxylicivirga sp. N1Y90]|uniref:translocation/assembly module TamB domain-containing protein n=1 Tax=Carboxylicivirga fragile TaxID=3417571 RepID=UPI003D34BE1B|nr:translocation/assembly module TamB domain-containing protein [Marinilabiliaceae bacterium N1Y90]